MRGSDERQSSMFSYVGMEDRVPANHPLRSLLAMTQQALAAIRPTLDAMYAQTGRPSIAPEKLLRAQLIQVLYSVRSERLLVEQIRYNLLFRWFIGLGMDDEVWHATTFTQNRDRLLEHAVAGEFFRAVLAQAKQANLLSDEHFTVDGTFLEAWASQKSFKAKDGSDGNDPNQSGGRNATVDFHGQTRTNQTHASVTDPDARFRKKSHGTTAKLVHHGHLITENRHGLVLGTTVTIATGTAEPEAALALVDQLGLTTGTLGADKGYDTDALHDALRTRGITPHIARKRNRAAAATDPGYAVSQRRRKMIEEAFGWMKTIGLMRKLRHRGTNLVGWLFAFTAAAYNLVRMRRLIPEARLIAVP